MEYLLRMENVSKIYGNGIVANKDVSFSLKQGEIHALVGENGAGKTTLMKILFGMEKPSSGKLYLRDKELDINSSNDAIKHGIGMVHQHFMLLDSFTVAQNITLGIEPANHHFVDENAAVAFTEQLSRQYNFAVDPRAVTGTLPVGIKQKIEILKALARGAKILILDEPTAVLTPQETEQLFEELVKLKKQGYTIVFISHKIKEIKAISDRVTIMRAGCSEGVFNTSEISEQEISNKIVGWKIDTSIHKKEHAFGEARISVTGLSYYGGEKVPILQDINFQIKSGMIMGIAGVQGNGQVELAEILTKSRCVESGSVKINQADIQSMTIKEMREKGFGYIPEDRQRQGVALTAAVNENLISNKYDTEEFCKKGILKKKKISEYARQMIEEYSVKCSGENGRIDGLSGGNMQKVVVARECMEETKVLIAEQPTRGVDIGAAHIIHQNIVKLRDSGSAVLLFSADMAELIKLSDVLAVMYEGRFVAYYENLSDITEEELGLYMLGIKKQDESQIRRMRYE